jgi:hypothetical protein
VIFQTKDIISNSVTICTYSVFTHTATGTLPGAMKIFEVFFLDVLGHILPILLFLQLILVPHTEASAILPDT